MQSTLFDFEPEKTRQSSFGKTSPEYSATKGTPSDAFLQRLLGKTANCSLQGSDGQTLVVCMDPKEQSRGGSWTPNISVWPSDAAVCSLSQVLEQGSIQQRYFLSAKACAGILRRAEKRGKTLPAPLQQALAAAAERQTAEAQQDSCNLSPHMGGGRTSGAVEVAACLVAKGQKCDFEAETFCVHGTQDPDTRVDQAHTLGRNNGMENAVLSVALRGREGGATAELGDDIAGCLRAAGGGGDKPHVLAFSCKDHGADAGQISPTLRAMGHAGSHANAGGQVAVCVTGEVTHTLKADGFDGSEDGTGRGQPIVAAMAFTTEQTPKFNYECALTLTKQSPTGGGQIQSVMAGSAVRRLTPVECERLQGFPDNYTQVPYRNKPAADGPRYKAIGNSWAVPCARFVGMRVQLILQRLQS